MAQNRSHEQRFNLAISLQNLKENKLFIVLVLGILSFAGLYLGYPLFIIKETTLADSRASFSFLNDLFRPPLNVTSAALTDSRGQDEYKIKWGFDSKTPSACTEDHVVNLGYGVYLSVCRYKGNTIIDIRKFTGDVKIGITPTIVGIGLNVNQWYEVISHLSIIKQYINDLS